MSFKKHIWKGLTVAAAVLLSVGLLAQSASAAITVTTAAHTVVPVNPSGGPFSTLSADAVINLSAANDLVNGSIVTLSAPGGWEFNTAATVAGSTTAPGLGFAAVNGTVTATTITWNVTAANTGAGTLTFDTNGPLLIRSTSTSTPSGNLTVTTTLGAAITGVNLGTIFAPSSIATNGTQKLTVTVTNGDANNIRSDGTTSVTLTASLFNDVNGNNIIDGTECSANPQYQGVIISWTTSRGTLSSSSSTTSSTSSQTSTGCVATIPFRGNGTTGTANITAVTTQPVALVATLNVQVVAGTITPTDLKFRDVTNSGHVAANIDTVYVTTNNVSQVRFRVANSSDQGSNGQVIQATVDKGNIVPWTDGNNDNIVQSGEVPTSCSDNVTTTFNSKRNTIDGTDVEGVAVFFVCAKAGQAAGPIKVTAKNLTTTMADASTTLTSAGVPNKIETTVSGNTVQVTVKDKDGNNVAENTPVTFQVPSFTGTVAPGCALTSAGKVSASAAFSGAGGQVLITVFHSSSGTAAGCSGNAVTNGNTVGASTTVNVGAGGGTPAPGGAGGFTGSAPARGSIGLLVTNQASSAAGLVSALGAAGCTVESLAVLEGGVWKIYINGAPAVVNSAFPGTVAATTAFFVRCAA